MSEGLATPVERVRADRQRVAHAMPFGAQLTASGTRFRLWAPAAESVDVAVGDAANAKRHPLRRIGRGWFEATIDGVRAGTRYMYRIDDRIDVPDPASRWNPDGVHGRSAVVDAASYAWRATRWRGRPWTEAVVYEMHVGAFTRQGTFAAAIERLDDLVDLGATAIEIMPVAQFAGNRNWGYDGVLPFAPAACYGSPDELKRLIDEAHLRGLMVLIDVVYNHFGPEGNYLAEYAPQFFDTSEPTPWGAAINFDGPQSENVRAFFVHNALYWTTEFRADGLRLDAVHAIVDRSTPDIVTEIATTVRRAVEHDRHVHIVVENDRNEARYLQRDADGSARCASAQWNDDVHHALHVLATGERDGYYAEFAERPLEHLGRALAEGFAWQGERSAWRDDEPRGDPSAALPTVAFVDFTQTHDQVGNRAFGERLAALAPAPALRAATACVLLAPAVPMLFMGEEFAASTPFLFFCDFAPELAGAVTRGRRDEFRRFARFRDPPERESIPDPNAPQTFEASKLDWEEAQSARGREWLAFHRELLAVRNAHIVPRLGASVRGGRFDVDGPVLHVRWGLADGARLNILVNFGDAPARREPLAGDVLYAVGADTRTGELPPLAFACTLERA